MQLAMVRKSMLYLDLDVISSSFKSKQPIDEVFFSFLSVYLELLFLLSIQFFSNKCYADYQMVVLPCW